MYIDKDLYVKILDSVPIATVDIVILNKKKDKVLLFKRSNNPLKGVYYTPGGRINKNEPINNAVVRKMKEELDLDLNLNNLKYLGIIEEFFEKSSFENIKVHCINVVYSYILEDNIEINLDQQHENYNWFDVKDQKLHFYVRQKINLLNPLTS